MPWELACDPCWNGNQDRLPTSKRTEGVSLGILGPVGTTHLSTLMSSIQALLRSQLGLDKSFGKCLKPEEVNSRDLGEPLTFPPSVPAPGFPRGKFMGRLCLFDLGAWLDLLTPLLHLRHQKATIHQLCQIWIPYPPSSLPPSWNPKFLSRACAHSCLRTEGVAMGSQLIPWSSVMPEECKAQTSLV